MKIDHIGYAIKSIEKSKADLEKVGYKFGELIEDEDRNIEIVFGEKDGYKIELVAPRDKSGSPVDKIIKRIGNGPYHICYVSTDFENEIKQLQKENYKMIIEPAPAVAFDGRKVVFLMKLDVGLIEVVEDRI